MFIKKTEDVFDARKHERTMRLAPYIMQGPAVILLVIFTIIPMLYLLYISFFEYDLLTEPVFVGFANYKRLFEVELSFWNSLINTVVYTVATTFFLILFALLLSIWMQSDSRLDAFAQRLMFLPHLCSSVAIALVKKSGNVGGYQVFKFDNIITLSDYFVGSGCTIKTDGTIAK